MRFHILNPVLRTLLLLLCAVISSGLLLAQSGPNLALGPAVSDCHPYIEAPLLFAQPDTSNVGMLSFEIYFPTDIFQDVFISPNSMDNKPSILRSFSLQNEWGSHFTFFTSRVTENGRTVPGRWKIDIMGDGLFPNMKIPNGELLRIRFFPTPWAMPGGYEIAFSPYSVQFIDLFGNSVLGLAIQNGTITLIPCPPVSVTTTTATTTTLRATTTTLPQAVVRAGTISSSCTPFVEVPVFFLQPETSAIRSLALELDFPSEIFQDQYFAPYDMRNMPQILPGVALTWQPAYPYMMMAQPATRSGLAVSGAWNVFVQPLQAIPNSYIPSGEILRIRLFPRPGAPVGNYPLTVSPYSAFYSQNGKPIHGLSVISGQVILLPCISSP